MVKTEAESEDQQDAGEPMDVDTDIEHSVHGDSAAEGSECGKKNEYVLARYLLYVVVYLRLLIWLYFDIVEPSPMPRLHCLQVLPQGRPLRIPRGPPKLLLASPPRNRTFISPFTSS